jgi:23S rRNA (uridine2552-2'-O)-methyltransferase
VQSRPYYRGQDDDRQRMATRGKGKKLNKAWLHDHLTDPYVKLAQREGYRARAAYKLKEIDEELKLLAPGQLVVDLGAAPGAWSQYLRRKFGRGGGADPQAAAGPLQGEIVALDLLELEPIDGVDFIRGDFREPDVLAQLEARLAGRRVDVVLSDMAPNLSGVAATDSARMADLVELAIDFAQRHLRPEGALVCKVFHGSGYSQLVERFKSAFRTVKAVKPKASRARSAETFLVGLALKAGASAPGLRA